MSDNEKTTLTDAEIKQALECHANPDLATCKECPLLNRQDCAYKLSENALDLINRKDAEIERLQKLVEDTEEGCVIAMGFYKDKAIKEFAERLKDMYKHNTTSVTSLVTLFDNINNLVKEMAGDAE